MRRWHTKIQSCRLVPTHYDAVMGIELYILITSLAIFIGLVGVVWLLEKQRREQRELFKEATEKPSRVLSR